MQFRTAALGRRSAQYTSGALRSARAPAAGISAAAHDEAVVRLAGLDVAADLLHSHWASAPRSAACASAAARLLLVG